MLYNVSHFIPVIVPVGAWSSAAPPKRTWVHQSFLFLLSAACVAVYWQQTSIPIKSMPVSRPCSIPMTNRSVDNVMETEARVSSGRPEGGVSEGSGGRCAKLTLNTSLGLIVSLSPFCLKGSAATLSSSGPRPSAAFCHLALFMLDEHSQFLHSIGIVWLSPLFTVLNFIFN